MQRKLVDETGNRHGRWTVIRRVGESGEKGGAKWLCHCDCGTERIVAGGRLRNGKSKSCGCLQRELAGKRSFIDETRNRYGRWLVIERAESKHGITYWLCQCDCGEERAVPGVRLRSGKSKSCGCLLRELNSQRSLPKGEASFNAMVGSMKRKAKDRGYEWRLTKEEVYTLTKRNCFYCGMEPKQLAGNPSANGRYIYNGLDRVDNTRGYVFGNIVPCCRACNVAKNAMSLSEFRAWAIRLYEHFASV